MGFLQLFVTSSIPVLKVLLVTSVGALLAVDRVDILGEEARKHLNNVVFYVFSPALVAINLAKTITLESILLLWFMPVNILLTYIMGSVLGWIVIQVTKAPSHLKGLIFGCCSAGNLGSMVLILIPAICKEKGSPFGDPDVCHTYALAYSSLSMAIGAIFLWSYVYNLVRASSGVKRKPVNDLCPETSIHEETCMLLPQSCTDRTVLPEETSNMKCVLKKLSGAIDFKKLLAPSTVGVIIGFIVGAIPQIRQSMIGGSAPLRVIQDSADLLADGAIPTITLIMGGNLIKGLRGSDIRLSIIIGVIIVRYVILPFLGLAIVKGAINLGLVHADPLYRFVLLVQYAVPPAINIGTITQLFGSGESECSVIFLWTYALASVSLTLWSTLFLWFVS